MALKLADGKQLPVKAFIDQHNLGTWSKFRVKPLDEQLAILHGARLQRQAHSIVSADLTALEKAKVVFVFRENDLLNAISAKLKGSLGEDFCTITIPAGTEKLSSHDSKKLNDAYAVLKNREATCEAEKGMKLGAPKIRMDQTMKNIGRRISIEYIRTDGHSFTKWLSEPLDWRLFSQSTELVGQRDPEYYDKYVGSDAAKIDFAFVIKEAAMQAKESGAEGLVVILGQAYGVSQLSYAIHSHGSPLHGDLSSSNELKELYNFISDAAGKSGLKTYPALSLSSDIHDPKKKLVVLSKIGDIKFVEDSLGVCGLNEKNIQRLDIEKQALLADCHFWGMLEDSVPGPGYTGKIVFEKFEGTVVKNNNSGEFLPFCDINGKNDIDAITKRIRNQLRI